MKNSVVNSLKYYILKEKNIIFLLLGISMISSGIAVIQPLLMQKFIDSALLLKNIDNFYYFVSLIIVVSIFSILFSVFLQYNYTKLSIKVLYSLRIDIFEKIFLNKKLFFQKYRVGDLLSRIEGDISELQRFGIDSIFALFSALLGLVGALVIMFFFDITLAIFALVLFPLEFFLLKPMYSKMHDITKDVRQSSAIMGSFIIESLRYVNFLKKTNAVKSRKDSLSSLQDINKQKILEQQILQIKFTQIPVVIALLARVSLIVFGGLKVIDGEITVGELIAFLSYFSMVLSPVHTILGILNNIPKLKVSMQRLEEITPKEVSKKDIKFLEKNLDLELKNITFLYP
ncbi:MAG: ABC transporter ATP-binding protein, partial [Sphaerochaetaceae bacterium]|nr:ABC transporter ATP-binding protein [Sphaerochaetaceae bacterium]